MKAFIRRMGLVGLAAAIGGLLLLVGLVVVVADAQLRSEAATTAVTPTADEREKLEEADLYDDVVSDAPFVRRALILQNLASGGVIPERYLEVTETGEGDVTLSWGVRVERATFSLWGAGWQMKPVGILSFAGIALIIATTFVVAARWQKQHPLARN